MKKLKKFMAALLVALMALSVIPAGVLADDGNTDDAMPYGVIEAEEGATSNSWTPAGTKTVTTGAVPQTFNFTVTNTETKGLGTQEKPGAVENTTGTVIVNERDTPTKITFGNIEFTQPGYYVFKITEDAHDLFTAVGTTAYYALVQVDNNLNISWATMNSEPNLELIPDQDNSTVNLSKAAIAFENIMKAGYDFEVNKIVTGSASNPNDIFPVKVTIAGNTDSTAKVDIYALDEKGEIKTYSITGNGTVTVYVMDNTTISSTAIASGATVTVEETDSKGYTAAYTGDGSNLQFTIQKETQSGTITNTKNANTITGFVMHYTPYIALVVVAGVAVALIAKRRNHSEF